MAFGKSELNKLLPIPGGHFAFDDIVPAGCQYLNPLFITRVPTVNRKEQS